MSPGPAPVEQVIIIDAVGNGHPSSRGRRGDIGAARSRGGIESSTGASIVHAASIGGSRTISDSIVSRPHIPHDAFVVT